MESLARLEVNFLEVTFSVAASSSHIEHDDMLKPLLIKQATEQLK